MPIRLRGHHLLCVLTYQGFGYTPAFISNFNRLVRRLSHGESVWIVEGPDDICRPLMRHSGRGQSPHCTQDQILKRDSLALDSVSNCLKYPVKVGDTLQLDQKILRLLQTGFANGTLRSACAQCEWSQLCTKTAAHERYQTARLQIC